MRAQAFALFLLAGCDVGAVPTGNESGPDAGDGHMDANGGGAGSLQITAMTSETAGAVYLPNHVVAVWIEGPGSAFVKTIGRWADVQKGFLLSWTAQAGATDADAVSGATRNAHSLLDITWDLKNKDGTLVPDGTYTIRMETADRHATDANQNNQGTFTFVKGPSPQSQNNLSNGGFSNVTLVYTP